jgi:hypothetical protein
VVGPAFALSSTVEGGTTLPGLDERPWPRRYDLPLGLSVATLYALATLLQEKFTACNGFGHDGCGYGTWALDFPAHAIQNKLGSYGIQRALPSLVAWLCLKAWQVRPTAQAVVITFQLMNVGLVFIAAFTWSKIARLIEIRGTTTLLGALGMFGGYGVVKFTSWYPVLGDLWGFAFGFVALYGHLKRRDWLFAPVLLVGAFAWPSLLGVALPLWCLRCQRGGQQPAPRAVPLLAAGVLALAWLLFTVHNVRRGYWPPSLVPVETMPQVMRLSLLVGLAYCFFALREPLSSAELLRPALYLRAVASRRGLLAVGCVVLVRYAQARWSVPQEMGFSVWIRDTAIMTTFKPGIFLLAHVIYFGPLVALAALRWRAVVTHMRSYGPGLLVVCGLAVLFGLDSEARHGYAFAAIVLPFTLKVLDDLELERKTLIGLALTSVAFSRLWLTLPPDLPGAAAEFPAQTVFMSQGPWMSNVMYLVQLPIVGLFVFWLHRQVVRRERAALASGAPHAVDVELRVLREEPVRTGPGDPDALGRSEHVAVLGR